ncbi:unnamed protein product [Brugia pahangi]|uniref:Flavin-containing monooxygenase n=1 Tax=Brugia pahangi TaxID=6280 RepID=A0A0N4T4H2_BRUPA|nr:unnamed protein product [Brugia pahangi]
MIFGTDYSFQFPIVEDGNLIPVIDNKVDLYLHIFPPQLLPMIDYVTHMDELAKMVGVKPNLMKLVH